MAKDELSPNHEKLTLYRMPFRLQLLAALGCILVLFYSFQCHGWCNGLQVAATGMAIGGAATFVGLLFGFVFCYPRIKRGDAPAGTPSSDTIQDNSSLADISDWLTKIIVGVGLVELNKIPPALHFLAITLSPGLRPYNSPELAGSSVVFALALLLYFFPLGFMFGFIWTRFYFQEALKGLLERIRVLEKKRVAANFAEVADARIDEGRLDLAATQVDKALARDSNNAKALFVKARILKRQAWSPSSNTWDKSLLKEALHYASKASALIPDRAAPLYNMACYQALLDEPPGDVAATLRRAFEINPELARNAADDSDLRELREKDTSIQTLIDEYSKKSKAP